MDIEVYITESNLIEGVEGLAEVSQSLKAWEFLQEQEKITPGGLLYTHRLIMLNQWPEIAGQLRQENVRVGNYHAPHFRHVPFLMHDFITEMEHAISPEFRNLREFHPMIMHINFEKIHPFRDGNGRIGRMLMWWHELKTGRTPTLIEYKNRLDYYAWF